MAITFKVREQKLTTARGEQTLCFARAVSNGETTIEHLQRLVAKISAISEGDVRSVLMTLSQLVASELSEGRIVSLGDLGRMRIGLRSKASDNKEGFRSQDIKKARVVFVPGALIKESLMMASFRRQTLVSPPKPSTPSSSAGETGSSTPSGGGKSGGKHTGL